MTALAKLMDPPIVEVVAGVHFARIDALSPLTLGPYFDRKPDYKHRELQYALSDNMQFSLTQVPALRVWLRSDDSARLLQVQADRFYFNWRKTDASPYPRFSGGVLETVLDEWGQFAEFCQQAFGHAVEIGSIELAKVDLLVQGKHWTDFEDLGRLIPLLQPALQQSKSGAPDFVLQMSEHREGGVLTVGITNKLRAQSPRAVSIETRFVSDEGVRATDLRQAFQKGNTEVNEAFCAVIPPAQHATRFNGGLA